MRDAFLVIRAAARLYVRQRLRPDAEEATAQRTGIRNPSSPFRTWLRCMWHTGGTHDLDLASDRCRHCRKRWAELYPDDRAALGSYLR